LTVHRRTRKQVLEELLVETVAQRGSGCPILGDSQGQAGRGSAGAVGVQMSRWDVQMGTT